MVGHRFIEAAGERGLLGKFETVVLSEESRLAYDRVNLSKWFEGKSDADLSLVSEGQYEELGVEVVRGDAAVELDREARTVKLALGSCTSLRRASARHGLVPVRAADQGLQRTGLLRVSHDRRSGRDQGKPRRRRRAPW